MKNIYRHGDLLIRQIEKLPKGIKEVESNTIAEGEFTGHSHRLQTAVRTDMKIYTDIDGRKYFKVDKDGKLTHEEHKTITIEKGIYEVIIEREFNPFEESINQVQD